MKLTDLGNIPFNISILDSIFPDNSAIVAKAKRLEEAGNIIRLKRGLYVVDPRLSKKPINEFLIANHLYGPSYVSMQTALRYYGLIPERVYEVISMTTGLHKEYKNKIAAFSYIHCPMEYYNIGIDVIKGAGLQFLLASPEKALCDLMLYSNNLNLRYQSEIHSYLEEDIRFEMDALCNFNLEILRKCEEKGKKKNMISQLIKFIENGRHL
ncbi:MAG: hypothetical protein J1E82_07750 [Muribaculaceae bacterium]|nr:hypothetical protein [Muribaculaceae bacterium]